MAHGYHSGRSHLPGMASGYGCRIGYRRPRIPDLPQRSALPDIADRADSGDMDNLSAHKVEGVKKLIEATDAEL